MECIGLRLAQRSVATPSASSGMLVPSPTNVNNPLPHFRFTLFSQSFTVKIYHCCCGERVLPCGGVLLERHCVARGTIAREVIAGRGVP